MTKRKIPEIVLCRIWHESWHPRNLLTSDGLRLSVVFPGVWTHSNGPDFSGAMIELDGRLLTGPVEVHVRASDWFRHGHHEDSMYADVILHVVLDNDSDCLTTTNRGRNIPTVELRRFLTSDLDEFILRQPVTTLGRLGSSTCLPTLAGNRAGEIRAVLKSKGWERLVSKQLQLQQEMLRLPASEVLYRKLLDALGLVGNRRGMELLGDQLPLALLDNVQRQYGTYGLLAAVIGTAGFTPLHSNMADAANLDIAEVPVMESLFASISEAYAINPLPSSVWSLRRMRPLNHPVRRLASLVALLADSQEEGLLGRVVALADCEPGKWQSWLESVEPRIGRARRDQIIVNVFAPFVAAYAEITENAELEETMSELWERLPGRLDDSVVRRTLRQIVGKEKFPIRTALENQGLHQIGRFGCADLRCFECPIAVLALQYEKTGSSVPESRSVGSGRRDRTHLVE